MTMFQCFRDPRIHSWSQRLRSPMHAPAGTHPFLHYVHTLTHLPARCTNQLLPARTVGPHTARMFIGSHTHPAPMCVHHQLVHSHSGPMHTLYPYIRTQALAHAYVNPQMHNTHLTPDPHSCMTYTYLTVHHTACIYCLFEPQYNFFTPLFTCPAV